MNSFEIKEVEIKEIKNKISDNLERGGRLLAINGYVDKQNNNIVVYTVENNDGRQGYKVIVQENIPTITDIYKGAQWFEEEIQEMMPIKFIGLKESGRLFLPEEFSIGEGQILIMPLEELKKLKNK